MIKYVPFKEISDNYGVSDIPYSIKLTTLEWKEKRDKIAVRENYKCQKCNGKCMEDWLIELENGFVKAYPATYESIIEETDYYNSYGIYEFTYPKEIIRLVKQKNVLISNVHHTYYIIGKHPWEYPDKDLMLVCHNCHVMIHQQEQIKIYNDFNLIEGNVLKPCSRCDGTGYISQYSYWQNGICFECMGKRFTNW